MGNSNYKIGKPAFNKLLIKAIIPCYLWFGLKKLKVTVKEIAGKLPDKSGILIAPHHEDDADPFVIKKATKRRLNWIAATKFRSRSIFEYKLLRSITDMLGIISIDPKNPERNKGLFDYVTYLLKIGEAVVIFPEGNLRNERNNKRLGKAKDGVIRIAQFAQKKLRKKIQIYPIGLEYKKKDNVTEAYMRTGIPFYVSSKENPKKAMLKLIKEIAILSNIKNETHTFFKR